MCTRALSRLNLRVQFPHIGRHNGRLRAPDPERGVLHRAVPRRLRARHNRGRAPGRHARARRRRAQVADARRRHRGARRRAARDTQGHPDGGPEGERGHLRARHEHRVGERRPRVVQRRPAGVRRGEQHRQGYGGGQGQVSARGGDRGGAGQEDGVGGKSEERFTVCIFCILICNSQYSMADNLSQPLARNSLRPTRIDPSHTIALSFSPRLPNLLVLAFYHD